MSVNSEYRCPSCRQKVTQIFVPNGGKGHTRVGVRHSPTCQYFNRLASRYPRLVERIEKERSVA